MTEFSSQIQQPTSTASKLETIENIQQKVSFDGGDENDGHEISGHEIARHEKN